MTTLLHTILEERVFIQDSGMDYFEIKDMSFRRVLSEEDTICELDSFFLILPTNIYNILPNL